MTAAMRKKIECCRDCQKRHAGCHSTCDDYKREKAELEELNSARRTKANADAAYTSYHIDNKKKRRAKYNLHTRAGGKKL